jgi:hypothetical protein
MRSLAYSYPQAQQRAPQKKGHSFRLSAVDSDYSEEIKRGPVQQHPSHAGNATQRKLKTSLSVAPARLTVARKAKI